MTNENYLNQRNILLRFIGAGINISPNALKILLKIKVRNSDIEELIKNISFLEGFKSHLTLDILQHTKYAMLIKNINIVDNKKDHVPEKDEPIKLIKKKDYNLKENKKESFEQNKEEPIKLTKEKEDSQSVNEKKPITKSSNSSTLRKNRILESELDSLNSLTSETDNTEISSNSETNMISDATNEQNSKNNDDFEPEFFDDEPFLENSWENIEKTNIITEKIGSKRIDLKSLSGFKPLAAEYEPQIKILSDPNKYLYSSGKIEEFVELMNDRFEKLKRIIQKNPEVNSVMKIRNVNSLQNSCDVEIIGMVKDKRTTGEARHFKLTVEDPSGEIDILIANNERNTEFYKKMVYLTTDQVVFISGFLKVDNQRKSRIIFANEIIWPQVPVSHHPIIPESPVSIAFISDVHIGSKNFMPKLFDRFIQYLNCEVGNDKVIQEAGKIKYLVIGGDLVDGIGIYPNQDAELNITDIYGQFKESARLLAKIPDYIKIIFIPGNHEPVRNALPHPNVPKKYCQDLLDMGVVMSGNPSTFELHGIKTLCFHGDSLIDLIQQIPGLNNDNPEKAMEEYLRCRHLAPIFGGKTELAPINKDWLVIDDIPHVFHTGHVHINGIGLYRNVLNINSGCFQSQTSFMKGLGINPTPGRPIIVNPMDGKLNVKTIDLNQ